MKRDIDEITALADRFQRESEAEDDRARRLALIGVAIRLHQARAQLADIEALDVARKAAA